MREIERGRKREGDRGEIEGEGCVKMYSVEICSMFGIEG